MTSIDDRFNNYLSQHPKILVAAGVFLGVAESIYTQVLPISGLRGLYCSPKPDTNPARFPIMRKTELVVGSASLVGAVYAIANRAIDEGFSEAIPQYGLWLVEAALYALGYGFKKLRKKKVDHVEELASVFD